MSAFFRGIRQRQQHIGYFVICFFLYALALALAKPAGWWAVVALWIVLVGLLELVYRWTVALARGTGKPGGPGRAVITMCLY